MKARCLVLAGLASLALTLGACHSEQKKSSTNMGMVNAKCPISGEQLGEDGWDKVTSRDYNGKKIGFCCSNCAGKFDKMSDADKAAKVAKVSN